MPILRRSFRLGTVPPAAHPRRSGWLLCLAIVATAAAGPSAHAELLRSEPGVGALVPAAPVQVTITFSEPVDVTPDGIAVFGPDGMRVDRSQARTRANDPTSVDAPLGALASGTHTVRWRAVSADGHPIDGSFQFSVGAASETTAPRESGTPPSPWWHAVARALHLLALSVLIGPLAIVLVLRPADDTLRARLWRLMVVGTVLLLPVAALMFAVQASAVAGSWSMVSEAGLRSLLDTRWGELWAIRAGCAVLALLLSLWGWRTAPDVSASPTLVGFVTAVVSAALVVASALNGHSAATDPIWLSAAVDSVHLAATAAWIGGLIALAVTIMPALRAMPDAEREAGLAALVPSFSTLALVCVQLLVVTGFYHAWAQIDGPASLTTTTYGRTLLVKLGLVAVMMLPAAINLLVLKPRLQDGAAEGVTPVFARLRRTVTIEIVLGLAVLVAVGRLTSIQPARVEAASARTEPAAAPAAALEPAVTLADLAGSTLVLLSASPAQVGANQIQIELRDPSPAGVPPQARLRVIPPEGSGVSPWSVVPKAEGARLVATAAFAPAGRWTVEVLLTGKGGTSSTASFSLEVPMRGARELLVAAAEQMNRLTSALEDVTTVADGVSTEASVIHQAPDREHWRQTSGGDEEEISIGPDRFIRTSDAWVHQQTSPTGWPAFAFHPSSAEPVLIGRETVGDVECFVIAYEDPGDGSHHRAWIAVDGLRVVQHASAAPGRRVVSRFSSFDAVPPITAPRAAR